MDIQFLTDKKYQLEYKLKVLQEQKINISNFEIEHQKVLQELKVIENEIRVYEFNDLYNKINNQLTEAYELINAYNFEVANNNLEFIKGNIDKLRSLGSEKEDWKLISISRQFKEVIKFKRDMIVTTRLKKITILEEALNTLIIEIDNLMNTKSKTSMTPSINFKVEKYIECYNEVQKLLTDHETHIKNDIDIQYNKLKKNLENYNKMIDNNKKKMDKKVGILLLLCLALVIVATFGANSSDSEEDTSSGSYNNETYEEQEIEDKTLSIGEEYTVDTVNGSYAVIINSISIGDDRHKQFYPEAEQVIKLDYTYGNMNIDNDIEINSYNFRMFDDKGNILEHSAYGFSGEKSPEGVPAGMKCEGANISYIAEEETEFVTLMIYNSSYSEKLYEMKVEI